MNFYPHHIGDFDRATRHLTRIERSIYRDMIEVYYDTEAALSLDIAVLCRKVLARSEEEKAAVLAILDEFFHETPGGWFHDRCEEELVEYRKKSSQAAAAGRASAIARADRRLAAINGNSTAVQLPFNDRSTYEQQHANCAPTNHEPVTSNQEPKKELPHTPQAGQPKKISGAIALSTYLDRCKAEGAKPIPECDSVFEYAAKAGISTEFLRLQWLEFKERYSVPGAKRYKAWATVFGKSVRGNWFKLWYALADGGYALTTVGLQAQRNHREAA